MAAESPLSEKDLSCTQCCKIYVDPVLLSCRHSFCKNCWEEYRQTKKTLKCPLCRKQCPKGFPPPNLQLKVLCDNFHQERNTSAVRSETLCILHKEELKLFCLEDKQPVCVVCRDSKLHSRHSFRPLDEAALEHRVTELTPECYSRTESKLKDPEILSGALIDVAKHLGNLKFRVWEKMKDIIKYTPVILDSNTAHECLAISDDLTSFVCTYESQQLPENPERSGHYLWVQGSEGFHSGTHCWDVDVENCEQWAIGVVTGSMKKGKAFFSGGIWKCHYENILYGSSSSGSPTTFLRVRESLRKIRVQLDFDKGQVSFWNSISGRHLQTFLYTFTETVFPYFCNQCKHHPLKILPKEISVVIQWPKYRKEELAYLTTDSSA
ncbi:hypothetical protein SRHO_G00085220 [Serrasalmus rhombeus]